MQANAPRSPSRFRLSKDPWLRWHPACESCPHCHKRHTTEEAATLNGLLKVESAEEV